MVIELLVRFRSLPHIRFKTRWSFVCGLKLSSTANDIRNTSVTAKLTIQLHLDWFYDFF